MKKRVFAAFLALSGFYLYAQDLNINTGDLLLELRADGGFHLFIRKKPDINSVLLTETTRDPAMRAVNYAYRAGEWNPINGDEIRILDGVPIPRESRIFSLISSTVVNHPVLGPAFHIYLPYVLYSVVCLSLLRGILPKIKKTYSDQYIATSSERQYTK